MRSRSAAAIAEARAARIAALTPDARVSLAIRLGEDGLASFMAAHQLDRRSARAHQSDAPAWTTAVEVGGPG